MVGFVQRLRYPAEWLFRSLRDRPQETLAKLFHASSWRKLRDAINDPEATEVIQRPWQAQGAVKQRVYGSYDEYVSHQATKFALLEYDARDVLKNDDKILSKVAFHRTVFESHPELAERKPANIVCLGARAGAEVKALLAMGHFAIGLDLNPGPENQFVMVGDFHNLVFADNSVDAVFTNALDHAMDLPRVLGEVVRVLKPGGYFIVDIIDGYEEGHAADHYDCLHWPTAAGFLGHLGKISGLAPLRIGKIAEAGNGRWNHAIMRKP